MNFVKKFSEIWSVPMGKIPVDSNMMFKGSSMANQLLDARKLKKQSRTSFGIIHAFNDVSIKLAEDAALSACSAPVNPSQLRKTRFNQQSKNIYPGIKLHDIKLIREPFKGGD